MNGALAGLNKREPGGSEVEKSLRRIEQDPAACAMRNAIGRHIGEVGLELDFGGPFNTMLGLSLRKAEARRTVLAISNRCGRTSWVDGTDRLRFREVDALRLDYGWNRIVLELTAMARRPLTPRLLMDVLAISSSERLRWTKDGRLTQSGNVMIKRGQLVSVPTYDVAFVEALLAAPGRISAWRNSDLQELGQMRPHSAE